MPEKRFIDVKKLAEYLEINKDTLYRWVSQKRIPYVKMGRSTRFDLKKIEDWIKEREVKVLSINNGGKYVYWSSSDVDTKVDMGCYLLSSDFSRTSLFA